MMRVILSVLFVIALIAGLMMFAPARLVYDALFPSGVQAGLVQGTVWTGHALRVRRGDLELQRVQTALEPGSLLSGRMRVQTEILDPRVQLRAVIGVGSNRIDVQDAEGVVALSAWPGLAAIPALSLAGDAVVQLDGVDVSLDQDGRCLSAEGAMMSPALADLGVRYDVDLPIVDMMLSCAGEQVALTLTGTGPTLDLDGRIVLSAPQPSYRLRATAHDPSAGQVLSLLGFQAQGADWVAESGAMEEG
jgi:hypothetical protein